MDTLRQAWSNQCRVLYALTIVEGTNRFARRSLGLFEELASILIHVIGFSALRLATGANSHHGLPMIPFLTSGVFLYWTFKTTIVPVSSFHVGKSRYAYLPRITQLDVLVARAIVNTTLYVFVTLLTFYTLVLVGLSDPIAHPFEVVGILILSGFWGFSAGLVLGFVFTYVEIIRTLMSGILRIVMYTSGIFYLWPEVPYKLRPIAIWNPFFHLSELMRSAYFQGYHSPIADWSFVIWTVAITCALGLVLERQCRGRYGRGQRKMERPDEAYASDLL